MTKIKGFKRLEKAKERPAIKKKKSQVDEIAAKIKNAKTIALVDQRALPDRLLQKAKKQLRGKAEFLMAKNIVLKKAIEKSKVAKELIEKIQSPSVLIISDELTPYAIYKHFRENRAMVAAKPGQITTIDIVVPAGETDLPPGPALSELKGAKIDAMIKGPKISIRKDSTVAKAGEKISVNVSKALQTLSILPFEAGLTMVAGYDGEFLYNSDILDVDPVMLTADLKASVSDAYNMSVNTAYPTELNIEHLLTSAVKLTSALVSQTGVYSTAHVDLLLTPALRMQNALENKVGAASTSAKTEDAPKEDETPKKEEKKAEEKTDEKPVENKK